MRPRGYQGACRSCRASACGCAEAQRSTVLFWGLIVVLVASLVSTTGCVTGPDGRRVLSPGARAVLEDVLACGVPLLSGVIAGETDYLAASSCHLQRVGQRIGRAIEGAPTVEHGREVVRAAELEHAGERREARVVASECEATARERLGAGEDGVR